MTEFTRVGAVLGAALAWLAPGPTEAAWRKAQSEHFVVYSSGDERSLRAYVEQLEAFDAVLRQRHGVRSKGSVRPLPIYVVRPVDMRRVTPSASRDLGGFYTAVDEDIFAVSRREYGSDHVLQHEYVHHFMLQHFPYAYPGWLTEGYAEYWMTTEIDARDIYIGKHNENRGSWLVHGEWLPLELVLRRRAGEFTDSNATAMYYAQAWLLTHWFMGEPARRAKLVEYMEAVAGGADPADAMRRATGVSLEAFEKMLRAYVRGGMPYEGWSRRQLPKPSIKVTVLPPSADDLLLEAQRIKRGAVDDALVAHVRARAARHPGDRLAELTLAHVEISGGDRAAGEAGLRRWLAAHPDDVEALEFLAEALMYAAEDEKDATKKQAMRQEARRHLGRATQVEPDRYQTLYAYARTLSGEPGEPSRNTLEVLDRAQELAPQLDALRLGFAAALLHHDMTGPAEIILGPVLNDPHDAKTAAAARELLAAVRAATPAPGAAEATPSARRP